MAVISPTEPKTKFKEIRKHQNFWPKSLTETGFCAKTSGGENGYEQNFTLLEAMYRIVLGQNNLLFHRHMV